MQNKIDQKTCNSNNNTNINNIIGVKANPMYILAKEKKAATHLLEHTGLNYPSFYYTFLYTGYLS